MNAETTTSTQPTSNQEEAKTETTQATSEPFQLSQEQQDFISSVLDQKQNVLLLGKAGVGKSTAVNSLCEEADRRNVKYVRCAPTGKAAIHIGGCTVHRLIAMLGSTYHQSQFLIDFLLIDEVSMCRADLMDKLSEALKKRMISEAPFGGVQVVLVGDPGQLPPVVNEKDDEHKFLQTHYRSHHFFGSNVFHQMKWEIQELTQIFRQKDSQFPKLLNMIREGNASKPVAYLNKFRVTQKPVGVILTGRNADADFINSQELRKISSPSTVYRAIVDGDLKPNDYPADRDLELRIGAKVMVIKNIYTGEEGATSLELINGDTGTVTELLSNSIVFHCDRTDQEHSISQDQGIWEKTEAKFDDETKELKRELKGRFIQIPVRLAWAVTIHKAQGATIEEVTIDFRKPMFAAGQAYVALSRGVALNKVWILGKIRAKDVQVDPTVVDFLNSRLDSQFVGIKKGGKYDVPEEDISNEAKQEKADKAFEEMFS